MDNLFVVELGNQYESCKDAYHGHHAPITAKTMMAVIGVKPITARAVMAVKGVKPVNDFFQFANEGINKIRSRNRS
jgi:hypothetical protein